MSTQAVWYTRNNVKRVDFVDTKIEVDSDSPSQHADAEDDGYGVVAEPADAMSATRKRRARKQRSRANGVRIGDSAVEALSGSQQSKRRKMLRLMRQKWDDEHPDEPYPDDIKSLPCQTQPRQYPVTVHPANVRPNPPRARWARRTWWHAKSCWFGDDAQSSEVGPWSYADDTWAASSHDR